jgi:hypothetical protein
MFAHFSQFPARSIVFVATILCGSSISGVASAAPVGEFFPAPVDFSLGGVARDALLSIETRWLQDGLDNLEKARKETGAALEKATGGAPDEVAALQARLKKIEILIAETKEELTLAKNSTDGDRAVQRPRKEKLLLNVNQWINELNHLATEQMKIAIMKDGNEALAAQNRNFQLSEQADNLEKAKRDPSIENWAK